MRLGRHSQAVRDSPRTAAELVADAIRGAIIDGTLQDNDALRQAELAEEFGVSRIPIREALIRLEAEGFVRIHSNAGARVSRLSHHEVREIYQIRTALEGLALRLAIPRLSADDLARARSALGTTEDRTANQGYGEWNAAFHMALYEPAQAPRLLNLIRQLHLQADRYLRLAYSRFGSYFEQSQREHRAILAACERREPDEAVSLLNDHLDWVRVHLEEHLLQLHQPSEPRSTERPAG